MTDTFRLDQRLATGAVEIADVLKIGRLVAKWLDGEHAAGRTDGALVPARIEFDGADVTVSPRIDDRYLIRTYQAPENLDGSSATPASDQFALAAILYQALCGGRAFPGEDTRQVRASITTGQRVPLAARVSGLAFAVDAVFERAFALEPAARFAHCEAFIDALAESIDTYSPSHPDVLLKPSAPGSKPTGATLRPQFPWLRVLLAVLLIAIVAVILTLKL
jgi:serine/threonine-protein kinase